MISASATIDTFAAIAEPRRRRLLESLGAGETPVNDIVLRLGWPQPMVSKHLGVLKTVGLVSVRKQGRERLYRVNGQQIKIVHDWTLTFERFWSHQLTRIKQRAERKANRHSS